MASTVSHLGYLWRAGDRLNFRWSTEPVEGAFVQLTPAPSIKGWELKGATTELKSNANLPKEFFAGLSNFFRFARKKGIVITWLQPVAKVALYFGEGRAIKNLVAGDSFDVGSVECAGFIDADSEQIDDLHEKKNFSKGMFTNAILEAKGDSVDLSDLPVLKQGVTTAPPAPTSASQPQVTQQKAQVSPQPAAALSGQGCYLVVEKAGDGQAQAITVVCRWSKAFVPGAVGFFEPSLDKVPTTSWKYNNGGTRVVLMSGTSAARGAPVKYYEAWVSFLNEARKMGGKFTMLPAEDATYSTLVMFQREASEKLFHAKPGDPLHLLDKALGFVCNDSKENQFFNVSSMSPAIILAEGKKNGALTTWTVDQEIARKIMENEQKAKEEAERNAKQEHQVQEAAQSACEAKEENKAEAAETSPRKAEAEALRERAASALEAELTAEEERKARELAEAAEAARKVEEERKAKEAAEASEMERKAQEERRAREAAEAAEAARKIEEERKAREAAEALEAARKAEEERKSKEEAKAKAEEEAKARKAAEAAEVARKAEEERRAREARIAEETRKNREAKKAEDARKAEDERKAGELAEATAKAACKIGKQNASDVVNLQDFETLVTRLQMAAERLVPGTTQRPVATPISAAGTSVPSAIDLRGFEALVTSMELSASKLGL